MAWSPPADLIARAERYPLPPMRSGVVWVPGESVQLSTDASGRYVWGPGLAAVVTYFSKPPYSVRAFYGRGRGATPNMFPKRDSHQSGYAVDIMARGDNLRAIATYLLDNAEAMGVQGIIADHRSWYTGRTPRFRDYTRANKHTDHVHLELNADGLRAATPWYRTQDTSVFAGLFDDPSPFGPGSRLVTFSVIALAAGLAYAVYAVA